VIVHDPNISPDILSVVVIDAVDEVQNDERVIEVYLGRKKKAEAA